MLVAAAVLLPLVLKSAVISASSGLITTFGLIWVLSVLVVFHVNRNMFASFVSKCRSQWRFFVGARGAQTPQILPRPPKFLDTVVLLLVELIGSMVPVNFA